MNWDWNYEPTEENMDANNGLVSHNVFLDYALIMH
jgi:hypothetical protein